MDIDKLEEALVIINGVLITLLLIGFCIIAR